MKHNSFANHNAFSRLNKKSNLTIFGNLELRLDILMAFVYYILIVREIILWIDMLPIALFHGLITSLGYSFITAVFILKSLILKSSYKKSYETNDNSAYKKILLIKALSLIIFTLFWIGFNFFFTPTTPFRIAFLIHSICWVCLSIYPTVKSLQELYDDSDVNI